MSDRKQGFMKVYKWVLEELKDDYKALGFYVHLLSKMWCQREAFDYVVNDRTYKILAGQCMSSYRRLKKDLGIDRDTSKRIIAKLEKITALQCEFKDYVYKSGKKTCDGLLFTALTPVDYQLYHERKSALAYDGNTKKPITEKRSLIKTEYINKTEYKKEHTTRERVCERASDETYDYQDSQSYGSEEPKNIPPEPLDDPNDIRFNLDQRFDPRVRESLWRQLAVDWYYWASDNGKVRVFVFTKFVDSVRAMIDSGQVDEQTLREMFDKVVKVNVFWQRNFKQIYRWNDYFQTGETRLNACLNDLKELQQKNITKKTESGYDGFVGDIDYMKELGL